MTDIHTTIIATLDRIIAESQPGSIGSKTLTSNPEKVAILDLATIVRDQEERLINVERFAVEQLPDRIVNPEPADLSPIGGDAEQATDQPKRRGPGRPPKDRD